MMNQPGKQPFSSRRPAQRLLGCCLFAIATLLLAGCQSTQPTDPIKVGLVAPFSGPEAAAGEAIQRGMLLAIDEINAAGGVLGRPIELVSQNLMTMEETAVSDLINNDSVVALFGGVFDGKMPGYRNLANEKEIPLFGAWGAATYTADIPRDHAYLFCVSITNTDAGQFLAQYGTRVLGIQQPAIISDQSDWSMANVEPLKIGLSEQGIPSVAIASFDSGDANMLSELVALRDTKADALFLLAGTFESTAVIRTLATLGWDVPVLSYWGASSRAFIEQAGLENVSDVYILQTFAFADAPSDKSQALLTAYHQRFGTNQLSEIREPTAVAQAYDGIHLLAQAVEQAGTTTGSSVKSALETLETPYDGVIKVYKRPFSPTNHTALTTDDYMMTVWHINTLIPAPRPRLEN
ncbi:MAG: ABC transporter substrate-binding protein [Anaerolineales bacterium]|nr:ABC transporter substrate-binding protein [Anaerolineales bacterium]